MSKAKKKTMKRIAPKIGIGKADLDKVCKVLSGILADQHVLYIKKRNFHWNLVGERFHTLHEFYEGQYGVLEKAIDETAERIRQLGGTAPGSMSEFLKLASLGEVHGNLIDGEETIEALVKDHETTIRSLRIAIDKVSADEGTADFLTGLMQTHEQMAWMLRSFLR